MLRSLLPILATAPFLALAATPTDTVAGGADIQRFQPDPVPLAGFGAGSGDTLEPGDFGLGLHLNYARNPLLVLVDGQRVESSITNNLTAHLHGAVALHEYFELGLGLPFVVHQDTNDVRTPELSGRGPGDLRVQPRVRVLSQWRHGLSLVLSPTVTVPLGGGALLVGEPGVGFVPEVSLMRRWGRTFLSGSASMRVRGAKTVLPGTTLGNEVILRLAGGKPLGENLEAILELGGGVALATIDRGWQGNPLEALLGLRRRIDDRWAFDLAVGAGLLSAPGTPDVRVVAGVTYGRGLRPKSDVACTRVEPSGAIQKRALGRDQDGDGIDDTCDLCVDRAESVNDLDDADGCPEPDTDGDGLLDVKDECPTAAGKAPTGCPDTDGDGLLDREDECVNEPGARPTGCPDADGDGLLDRNDRCPAAPGPAPSGCPDTDGDGLLDPDDKCPAAPEDRDGFEDEDGCPDPDNDRDGILDPQDKCPSEPETINGVTDEDGCPDKGRTLVVVKKEKIEILDMVYFATNKDIIEQRSFGLLKQVALTIKAHPEITKLRVEGHTDDVGGRVKNLDLSQRRAESVVRFLVQEGVDAARLTPQGFAFDRPLVPNTTAKNRATNRRVEFNIVDDSATPAGATP